MKGLELPITTLIVLVLGLIVFIGIVVLFSGVWTPSTGGINAEAQKNNGCRVFLGTGCSDTTTVVIQADLNGDSKIGELPGDSLQKLCEKYFACNTGDKVRCCKDVCGCP